MNDLTTARPWRCRVCGALLGMQQGAELHVKYKDVSHWIAGRCRHACRRCGAMNTLHVGPTCGSLSAGEGGAK
jgi:hypothetical protein